MTLFFSLVLVLVVLTLRCLLDTQVMFSASQSSWKKLLSSVSHQQNSCCLCSLYCEPVVTVWHAHLFKGELLGRTIFSGGWSDQESVPQVRGGGRGLRGVAALDHHAQGRVPSERRCVQDFHTNRDGPDGEEEERGKIARDVPSQSHRPPPWLAHPRRVDPSHLGQHHPQAC